MVLYGATSGEAFFNGMAGERFAVRNSGATAVVEGLGDHGCEYMTNGLVVVLGKCGRNFAAGMSGGIAYVLDEKGDFAEKRCNHRGRGSGAGRRRGRPARLYSLIARHVEDTGSPRGKWILENWEQMLPKFIKVFPHEYKRVLKSARAAAVARAGSREREGAFGGAAWVKSQASWNTRAKCRSAAPPAERIKDWFEIYQPFPEDNIRTQGARCMDCGVPFCHTGCPLTNIIPDWNDLVYRGRWRERCASCTPPTTSPNSPAASVRRRARRRACWASTSRRSPSSRSRRPSSTARSRRASSCRSLPPVRTGKRVAVIGSGPAGLAAAQQLARAGHAVTVFEKADRIGGLLRYGIPNFKMEKHLIDRRLEQMAAEGVKFLTNAHVGASVPVEDLRREFDAILLAGGAEQPRDLNVPGRELKGIHFAMEFLPQQNKRCEGDTVPDQGAILATGKRVVIIGGGDTGADCLGTSPPAEARSSVHSVRTAAEAARCSARPRRRGRCGRCSCAWKARTKRAASASGASPPSNSPATSTAT